MAKTKPSSMSKNCLKQSHDSQKPLPSLSHDREFDKNKEEIQTVGRGKEAAARSRTKSSRNSRSANTSRRYHAQGGQRASTLIRAASSNKASIFENGGKKKTWNENGVANRKHKVCCMAVPPVILFIGIAVVVACGCSPAVLLVLHHHHHHHEERCVLLRRGISTMTGAGGGTEKKFVGRTPPLPRRVVERLRMVVVDSSITTTTTSISSSTSTSSTHHEEDDKMVDSTSSNKTIFENVGMNLVRTDAPTHLPAAAVAHDFSPPQQESPTADTVTTSIASSTTTIPTTNDMIGEPQQQEEEISDTFHTIENSTLLRQEFGSGVHPPRRRQQQQEKEEEEMTLCRFYLAKSKIPDSGLGIFTTRDISKGSEVGPPDIVIQVPDLNPYHADALRVLLFDYAWQGEETGGQYEGQRVYSFIPGFGMLANGHRHMYNTAQHYGSRIDNAGITRDKFPGAGSSSHYHEFEFRATSDIVAGSEILIDYGPNWFDEREIKGKIKTPENLSRLVHSVDWLRKNGICLDNLMVGKSSNPQAGRGGKNAEFKSW